MRLGVRSGVCTLVKLASGLCWLCVSKLACTRQSVRQTARTSSFNYAEFLFCRPIDKALHRCSFSNTYLHKSLIFIICMASCGFALAQRDLFCYPLRPSANQASLLLVHKVTERVYHVSLNSPLVCRLRDSHSKFHLVNVHKNALGLRVAQQISLRKCKTRNFCAHFAEKNTA